VEAAMKANYKRIIKFKEELTKAGKNFLDEMHRIYYNIELKAEKKI
jgi:hypothetical protein